MTGAIWAAAFVTVWVFMVMLIGAWWSIAKRRIEPPPTISHPINTHVEVFRDDDAHERIDTLTLAVSDGIARTDRAEKRIQKTVTSARRLVREAGLEHAGIEAEYAELLPPDDERVEALPPMPEGVVNGRSIRFPGGSLTLES